MISGFSEGCRCKHFVYPVVCHLWHRAFAVRASSIGHFNAEISDEFPNPRSIFMPIDLPGSHERAVKSSARRALGPMGDVLERSGVAFTMRCACARKSSSSGTANNKGGGEDDKDDDESVQSVQPDDGGDNHIGDEQDLGAAPLDIVSLA